MTRLLLLALCLSANLAVAQTNLTGPAAVLFKLAQSGNYFPTAANLHPDYLPTSDGKSFLVVWRATGTNTPNHWIVSLHGTHGFATDDLGIWSKYLGGRDIGVVSLQWWSGQNDERGSYYQPAQVYHEIDLALQKLHVKTNTVMFHGFSRGAANSYAIAAIDAGRGKRYFALNVASSGGVALDFPPTRGIAAGDYGNQPLRVTRWITCAGALDKNAERDGIAAMRKTAAWLRAQGATIEFSLEDPAHGHGALVLNPNNANRVIDFFLGEKP